MYNACNRRSGNKAVGGQRGGEAPDMDNRQRAYLLELCMEETQAAPVLGLCLLPRLLLLLSVRLPPLLSFQLMLAVTPWQWKSNHMLLVHLPISTHRHTHPAYLRTTSHLLPPLHIGMEQSYEMQPLPTHPAHCLD